MVEGISSLYDLFETSIKEMDDKPVIEEDPRSWKDINQGNYVMRMSKETFGSVSLPFDFLPVTGRLI